MNKRQLFDFIASLKASADEKDNCGQRLVCWYEDIAAGFLDAGAKPSAAPACQSRHA